MPTPIPSGEKTCVINKITGANCNWVAYVTTNLNNLEDIPGIIYTFFDKFSVSATYLNSLLDCFLQSELSSVGVTYNQTITGGQTDPQIIISSTVDSVVLTTTNTNVLFGIIASTVDSVEVRNSLAMLTIATGSHVRAIQTTGTGCMGTVKIGCQGNVASTLDGIISGSCYKGVSVDPGAIYGGITPCDNTACTDEITSLLASQIKDISLLLTWTNPANTSGNKIYYRIANTMVWLPIEEKGEVYGIFVNNVTGFAIFGLTPNTQYDFKVQNICASGFVSDGLTVTATTQSLNDVIIIQQSAYAGPNPIEYTFSTTQGTYVNTDLINRNWAYSRDGSIQQATDFTFDNSTGTVTPTTAYAPGEFISFLIL